MGVPTSGALSLRNIARERLYGSYGGGGTITGAVSMFDLLNGGQAGGSGDDYPALNTNSCNPTVTGEMSSWYGYDQNCVTYYNWQGKVPNRPTSRCAPATLNDNYYTTVTFANIVVGTVIYTNSSGSAVLASSDLIIVENTTWIQTNSSGAVTSINSCP
jgi:hypothetical protein